MYCSLSSVSPSHLHHAWEALPSSREALLSMAAAASSLPPGEALLSMAECCQQQMSEQPSDYMRLRRKRRAGKLQAAG